MEGKQYDWNACIHCGGRPVISSRWWAAGRAGGRALSNEDDVVDERCDGRAYEGAEPVHPVVLPDAGDDGWAEGQCAAGEDVAPTVRNCPNYLDKIGLLSINQSSLTEIIPVVSDMRLEQRPGSTRIPLFTS